MDSNASTHEWKAPSLIAAAEKRVCQNCKKKLADATPGKSLCVKCKKIPGKAEEYRQLAYQKTCMEKYGTINAFQAESVKKKLAKTNLEKYGDRNPAGKNSVLRPMFDKILKETGSERYAALRATMRERHGVDHWTHSPEMVKKVQSDWEKKHGKGKTNPMLFEGNKEHHQRRMAELAGEGFWKKIYDEKVAPTVLKRFGVDNVFKDVSFMCRVRKAATGYEWPMQIPEAKEKREDTCIKRYGGTHHMHDPEIFEKTMRAIRTMHLYECDYKSKSYLVLGTYEVMLLSCLLKKYGTDIKTGFQLDPICLDGSSRRYYPDFYVPDQDTYVECKSVYTLVGCKKHNFSSWIANKKKALAMKQLGKRLMWIIPNPLAGTVCQLPEDWTSLTRKQLLRYIKESQKVVQLLPEDRFEHRLLQRFGRQGEVQALLDDLQASDSQVRPRR
jgi:hypothetical protein